MEGIPGRLGGGGEEAAVPQAVRAPWELPVAAAGAPGLVVHLLGPPRKGLCCCVFSSQLSPVAISPCMGHGAALEA